MSGIFVKVDGGDGLSGGVGAEYRTVMRAVTAAQATGRRRVYLGPGTYAERVDLDASVDGLVLEGAWNDAWKKDCSPNRRELTTVRSPDLVGVRAAGLAAGLTLKDLTVATRNGVGPSPGAPGESTVGLMVVGGRVTLSNVAVVAGIGGSSMSPLPPMPVSGVAPCSGGAYATGAMGPAGDGGSGAIPGYFDSAGFHPGNGGQGSVGGGGLTGTPPTVAPGMVSCLTCTGSGLCPSCSGMIRPANGTAGTAGCGGVGGPPGPGGPGGGASVAVLAVQARVTADFTALQAQSGGSGSAGAAGAGGGFGASGAQGSPSSPCISSAGGTCTCTVTCGVVGPTVSATPGGPGGPGGRGGLGGAGGPGAGGFSVAVVLVGDAGVALDAGSTLAYGSPGGQGGLSAPPGQATDVLRY